MQNIHRGRGAIVAAMIAGAFMIATAPYTLAEEKSEHRSTGETIDDSTINTTVKSTLIGLDDVHARNINVETHKGRVALIGYVRTEEQHAAAINAAKGVNGVNEVIDALLVVKEKRSTGTTFDDQTIETKVKFGLTEAGADKALAVVTEVRNGEVLLGGFVSSQDVKAEIGEIAKGVSGVKKVHNRVAVKD